MLSRVDVEGEKSPEMILLSKTKEFRQSSPTSLNLSSLFTFFFFFCMFCLLIVSNYPQFVSITFFISSALSPKKTGATINSEYLYPPYFHYFMEC